MVTAHSKTKLTKRVPIAGFRFSRIHAEFIPFYGTCSNYGTTCFMASKMLKILGRTHRQNIN